MPRILAQAGDWAVGDLARGPVPGQAPIPLLSRTLPYPNLGYPISDGMGWGNEMHGGRGEAALLQPSTCLYLAWYQVMLLKSA